MNRLDDENLVLDDEDEVLRIIHWGRWILGLVMLAIIVLFVSGWLLRKGVAERAMSAWCEQQSLICTADFDEVGPDGAALSDLVIRAGGDVPLRADTVQAVLDWPQIFQPKLKSVTISEPILRGQFKEGRLSLFGLEKLAKGGGSGGGAAPQIEVINGHVVIVTDAGEVTAQVSIKGTLPQNGEIILTLDPADLTGPEGRIQWTGGDVNILAEEGHLDGIVSLRLETAALKGLTLNGAALEAKIETDSALELLSIVDLSGKIDEAYWADGTVTQMEIAGSATLDGVPKLSVAEAQAALRALTYDVKADQFVFREYGATQLDFAGALTRENDALSGDVGLTAFDVNSPQGGARSLIVTGHTRLSDQQGLLFDGQGVLEGVKLGDAYRGQITQPITLPSVLNGHGLSLRRAVDQMLRDFDTSLEFRLGKTGDEIIFHAEKPVEIESASGARVSITPAAGQPWANIKGTEVDLAGALKMSGGGLPTLSADLNALRYADRNIHLDVSKLNLASWTASGRTIGGQAQSLQVVTAQSGVEINANGQFSLAGGFPGIVLEPTRLSGALKASSQDKDWTVYRKGGQCLEVATQGAKAGAVTLGEMQFSACPEAGRFLHKGLGSLDLGTVSVPFSTGNTHGTVSLTDASLDYNAHKGLSLSILAGHLSLPMVLGERSFSVEGLAPRVGVMTGQGPLRLSARLGETQFGGEVIPASISATAFTFDGAMPETGVSGSLTANSVIIQDTREDPIYQPLITDIDATLLDGRMQMSAPLRLKRGGITVAQADVDLDILKLNGNAAIETRTLTFKAEGLQPHMLSERLRGLFTTATGALEGEARLKVTGGDVSGTGRVQVTGFGFQTQRLGRVVGVNGAVTFTDLLGLTTAPDQEVTVRSMNPGVPLQNGRLAFQLVDGKTLSVSDAVFPFAGGRLTLLPLDWALGGNTQAFEVVARDIELEQMIGVFNLPDIRASGTVGGRFPVLIDGTQILIQDAKLAAGPEGGQLAYTGEVGDKASAAGEYGEMAFDALKNLEFSVLELGLNGNLAGDMRVELLLVGENRDVLNGQPFEFDISIDSELAKLIQSRMYFSNQDWLETIGTGKLPAGGTVERDE